MDRSRCCTPNPNYYYTGGRVEPHCSNARPRRVAGSPAIKPAHPRPLSSFSPPAHSFLPCPIRPSPHSHVKRPPARLSRSHLNLSSRAISTVPAAPSRPAPVLRPRNCNLQVIFSGFFPILYPISRYHCRRHLPSIVQIARMFSTSLEVKGEVGGAVHAGI